MKYWLEKPQLFSDRSFLSGRFLYKRLQILPRTSITSSLCSKRSPMRQGRAPHTSTIIGEWTVLCHCDTEPSTVLLFSLFEILFGKSAYAYKRSSRCDENGGEQNVDHLLCGVGGTCADQRGGVDIERVYKLNHLKFYS